MEDVAGGRIGSRKPDLPPRRDVRIHAGICQKRRRKAVDQRRPRREIVEPGAWQSMHFGNYIGKQSRVKIEEIKQLTIGARCLDSHTVECSPHIGLRHQLFETQALK